MRKLFLLSLILFLSSCYEKTVTHKKCLVTSCEKINRVQSIHDEMNKNVEKYLVKTECGGIYIDHVSHRVGDSVEVTFIKYK